MSSHLVKASLSDNIMLERFITYSYSPHAVSCIMQAILSTQARYAFLDSWPQMAVASSWIDLTFSMAQYLQRHSTWERLGTFHFNRIDNLQAAE